MIRSMRLLVPCLCLAACQATPPQPEDWTGFLNRVDRMDAVELQLTREAALARYTLEPTDPNRLRAAYVLSRPESSPEQLAQSIQLLAGIPAGSELAALRDLLRAEIGKTMELREAELQLQELQAQLGQSEARLDELQTQLDALKAIEQDMVESQEATDEMRP